jgi:hypothetical protein
MDKTINLPFHLLSKSGYLRGLQCVKSLYLNKYFPKLRDELPEKTKAIFETGQEVGIYAQQLFPGGVNCGFDITKNGQKSAVLTAQAISGGKEVIYEAAFQFEEVLIIADIMVKSGNKWKIYEVKSSTSVADYQINDTSIQYYIISKCGIDIEDISVIYINNQYVKKGDIDINQLFTVESVLDRVLQIQDFVNNKIEEFKKILEVKTIPDVNIGPHCGKPFECDFTGHCWKHIPEYSVFDLSRIGKKAFELYENGITEIKDIPENFELSTKQSVEKNCFAGKKNFIDKGEINNFLADVKYPLYFMDFETIQTAIPIFDNSRPYQQIVFQYSIYYKESKDSEPVHFEYLSNGKSDPRPEFIKQLLEDTKNPGTILVYNISFEKSRMKELAIDFPEYADKIEERITRLVDLMTPFQNKNYYKPGMKGKYSLKSVLPAISDEYNYDNLEIKEGGTASAEYLRMGSLPDENEIKKIRKNLLEYCGMDTYGMIVILEELERVMSKG